MLMRRIRTNYTECRGCKSSFVRIRGLIHHDGFCCSDKCFLAVAPRPAPKIIGLGVGSRNNYNNKSPDKTRHKRNKLPSKKQNSQMFYKSDAWLALRYEVLKKYGRVCMCCGNTKGSMHVDHIKPRSRHPELQLAFTNLQVLCADCNLGKLDRDDTDFRSTNNGGT